MIPQWRCLSERNTRGQKPYRGGEERSHAGVSPQYALQSRDGYITDGSCCRGRLEVARLLYVQVREGHEYSEGGEGDVAVSISVPEIAHLVPPLFDTSLAMYAAAWYMHV